MNRILVTGGSGFIGSHTCLNLIENGYNIIVLDSHVNSSPKTLKRVIEIYEKNANKNKVDLNLVEGDLRDKDTLNKIFYTSMKEGKSIDAVIHFAGLKSVEESVRYPIKYWDNNVNGTINLITAMKEYDCKTIVFSSSATIYRIADKSFLKEDSEIKPINPYGTTKMVIENLLSNLFSEPTSDWRISNLRYFNPIGAHASGLIGEAPLGVPNNIFPYITQVATGERKELRIFGNDWPTKDGSGVRDYIHVMDLAEAHVAALEHILTRSPEILTLNIGTGKGTSVLELVNTFEQVNKIKIPYKITSRRVGDISSIVSDNSKAISTLNWSPKRTLEDMCADGMNWQKNNPKGYQ